MPEDSLHEWGKWSRTAVGRGQDQTLPTFKSGKPNMLDIELEW